MISIMENILRITVYSTVLKRMKPHSFEKNETATIFFLKKPSLVIYIYHELYKLYCTSFIQTHHGLLVCHVVY